MPAEVKAKPFDKNIHTKAIDAITCKIIRMMLKAFPVFPPFAFFVLFIFVFFLELPVSELYP